MEPLIFTYRLVACWVYVWFGDVDDVIFRIEKNMDLKVKQSNVNVFVNRTQHNIASMQIEKVSVLGKAWWKNILRLPKENEWDTSAGVFGFIWQYVLFNLIFLSIVISLNVECLWPLCRGRLCCEQVLEIQHLLINCISYVICSLVFIGTLFL